MTESLLNNNALASLARQAAPPVLKAIKTASARTGVNFAYLMEQAAAESSFNAKAEAATSSAAGLYQFIESTWLGMVKKHGHKYGMGDMAAKINDRNQVADDAARAEILALRKDPEKAALLAAEFAAENKRYLARHVDGEIGSTELYFAHFMGASGAAGFLNAMKENPLQNAADLFPRAARANRNVFYDRKTGKARTLAGVYEFFDKKFKAGADKAVSTAPEKARSGKPHNIDFMRRHQSLETVRQQHHNMIGKTIAALSTNTFALQKDHQTAAMASGWPFSNPVAARTGLVFNPAELMLLAARDLPTDHRQN